MDENLYELNLDSIKKKISKEIFNSEVIKNNDVFLKMFACFDERFLFLSKYDGLTDLLNKFKQNKIQAGIEDIITEFNLAYIILKSNPSAVIQYEPKIFDSEGNIVRRRPDFRIVFNNQLFYIQVKRVRKSQDYEENKDYYPDTFVPVNDETQIVNSLKKATGFVPPEQNCIYILAQEITFKAGMDDITTTEVLFGKELWGIVSGEMACIKRAKDGFFFSEEGKILNGYISLRKNSEALFAYYNMTLLINPFKEHNCKEILKLIPCEKILTYTMIPKFS